MQGPALQTPSSTTGTKRDKSPPPCGHAAHPTPMGSPQSQLCGCFGAQAPRQAPLHPKAGPSHLGGAHHTAPHVCWCLCTNQATCVCTRQGHIALDPGLCHSFQYSEHPQTNQEHPTLSRGQFRGLPVPPSPVVTTHSTTQVDTHLTNFRAKDFSFPVAAAAASSKSRLFPDSM